MRKLIALAALAAVLAAPAAATTPPTQMWPPAKLPPTKAFLKHEGRRVLKCYRWLFTSKQQYGYVDWCVEVAPAA